VIEYVKIRQNDKLQRPSDFDPLESMLMQSRKLSRLLLSWQKLKVLALLNSMPRMRPAERLITKPGGYEGKSGVSKGLEV